MKRHKIKREMPDTSKPLCWKDEERDLAYYIHDRVELMHQVFSLLKPKELKAMAPESVRNLSIDNLEELCLEELLGISSKRLCSVLDGAEAPSDTESSSESDKDPLETISLDSISSDEGDLSPVPVREKGTKSKHHCKRRERRQKTKKIKTKDTPIGSSANGNKEAGSRAAERAGMTVLELLELQARARAIRAQLAAEHINKGKGPSAQPSHIDTGDEDDVLIKEEQPEVVELSSDDEKPDIRMLEENLIAAQAANSDNQINKDLGNEESQSSKTVTKKRNDLTIIVPQTQSRRFKLNRNNVTASRAMETHRNDKTQQDPKSDCKITTAKPNVPTVDKANDVIKRDVNPANKIEKPSLVYDKKKEKTKKNKENKIKRKKKKDKEGSDHDEITLQLSDSEKMDLLEDFDRKHYDTVSSSNSSDSDDSSSKSGSDTFNRQETYAGGDGDRSKQVPEIKTDVIMITEEKNNKIDNGIISEGNITTDVVTETKEVDVPNVLNDEELTIVVEETAARADTNGTCIQSKEKVLEVLCIEDIPLREDIIEVQVANSEQNETETGPKILTSAENLIEDNIISKDTSTKIIITKVTKHIDINEKQDAENKEKEESKDKEKQLSSGEISEKSSSEIEVFDLKSEVVCISDEENGKSSSKKKKNKKKAKKEKKKKRQNLDFSKVSDQNCYKEIKGPLTNLTEAVSESESTPINIDSDNVYQVLEISDDSSCYEVEGVSVLSKEPTSEEIEALSAKIDHEIEREEVVTDEQIRDYERRQVKNDSEQTESVENISWKDRYLGSKKVRRVLTTSNILNALRKKNKELKRKLEECKKKEVELAVPEPEPQVEERVEEGSIEQYNTLQGSTKYVDPIQETVVGEEKANEENPQDMDKDNDTVPTENIKMKETAKVKDLNKEMKKDAKQLLKMYKRLLKYNNMDKRKDPNKPKKKKNKKQKKTKDVGNTIENNSV